MALQSQAIAAQLAWERCPIGMMDLRLPKSARMHGRHCNDVDGIAALRGRTLDDPRTSIFYMLMAYPQSHLLWTAEQIKVVGMGRARELAVTLTNERTGLSVTTGWEVTDSGLLPVPPVSSRR